ncbi:putative nuclease [Escherichia phage vB_EcoS_fPoEco01]|uniref:putative nuclease n=1 Tax=Escherichia phage vB_EcoS_fPoEco01 TaxID=2762429 RepID=UPI0018629C57|nr:putative nuclease [Escherichia phage vB_EcoS_fPoEco01]QNO11829.1 putative nuclease [Escherichia phage vB_EcoS_fPoEco01]
MKLKERGGNNDVHALLSPSGAKKWLSCAASLACEKDIPNTSGKAAVLGTAMHTIAEAHLNAYIRGTALPLEREVGAYVLDEGKGQIKALISPMKGAVLITADMIEQVRKYTDYCKAIIDVATYAKLEMRVNLTEVLHPGYEGVETFGTADLVAVQELANTDEHILIIGDLKTGRHRVEAKENKQLMLYALGVYRRLKRRYNITVVRLVIFQPCAGGASEWDISVEGLELFAKFAQKRALLALDAYSRGKKNLKASDFKPSVDGCQWCRFSEQCAARTKTVNAVLAEELEDDFALELTPEQLVAEYEKLPLLRQHIDKVEKAMAAALHSGKKVPGYKLVEGRPGNRAWKDAEKVAGKYGIALMKQVLMTPTEAVKVIPEDELKDFITRKPGAPCVATANDKRPEWNRVSEEDLE